MSTNISPNMNMPIPIVGQEPGPQWATDLNNSLSIVDQHNHAAGSGVQINPGGININTDLPMNGNNLTLARTLRMSPQLTIPSDPTDIGCLEVVGADLYYNDTIGNQIRITQSGSIVGTAGSISGLVSPASATYVPGDSTFVWQSNTNIAANMDFGSAIFRNLTANSKGVTVEAAASLASDYSLVLPLVPISQKFLSLDNAGNMAAVWSVDNSTIEISSNIVQVKDAGITNAKLATDSVDTANIVDGAVTLAKLDPTIASNLLNTTFTASGTFTVPTGVTNLIFLGVGGGGGGGGGAANGGSSAGGAGGSSPQPQLLAFPGLTPGEILTITVGGGGSGGTFGATGAQGGLTSVSGSVSGLLLRFFGGPGGGGGSGTTGGTPFSLQAQSGVFFISGGAGGNASSNGSGGGEGVFTTGTSPAGNAVGGRGGGGGGGAGRGGGGAGGDGDVPGGNAGAATAGGGGGGGGSQIGGNGGSGYLVIFYPGLS